MAGSRGGGKTECGLWDFASDVGKGWGRSWRGIVFRHEYKELEEVVERSHELFTPHFPGAKFNTAKSDYFWRFPTGEKLLFRTGKKASDYKAYHGSQYPWLMFEELTNWADDSFYMPMHSVCRGKVPGMPRRIRATTNPYGVGHHWVKKRFVDPLGGRDTGMFKDPETGRSIALVTSQWWENDYLIENDPEYIRSLFGDTNEARRKAWTTGDWNIVSGGMFGDVWDRHTNILPAIDVREFLKAGWYLDRSFDWGSSSPFSVGWFAESNGKAINVGGEQRTFPKGSLIRFAEWYGNDPKKSNVGLKMLNADIARGILKREEQMGLAGKVRPGPADNQIHNFVDGDSIAKIMERVGVKWTPSDKSKGSRVNGWGLMRDMMQAAHPVDIEGKRIPPEEPGLYCTEICTDFISIIPNASRDDKNMDDIDTDSEDHIPDEVRYRVTAKKRNTMKRSRLGGI